MNVSISTAMQPHAGQLARQALQLDDAGSLATPAWVAPILERCQTRYTGEDGVLISALGPNGRVSDATPLLADFGDVLPFLWHFGLHDFVNRQLDLAGRYLDRGLFKWQGRVQLFQNHDWLLGLTDLYRQSADQKVLRMAQAGASTLGEYFSGDLLFDEKTDKAHWRSLLKPASSFNGGYIELWLELFEYSQNPTYLQWACRLAEGWTRTESFRRHGVFCRVQSTRSAAAAAILERLASLKARLFKDNTNLVWGILALYRHSREQRWREALGRWVSGFRAHFWNQGNVYLMLDSRLRGYEPSLKAGFSSLDLLCDLHHAGIQPQQTLELATSVADFWLRQQWHSGLFPVLPGGSQNHLDANVDLTVALWKLHALTGEDGYAQSALRCREALLDAHATTGGYCLAVDKSNGIADARIIVKYQALLTKLALLPRDSGEMFSNPNLRELLRDR